MNRPAGLKQRVNLAHGRSKDTDEEVRDAGRFINAQEEVGEHPPYFCL